MSQASWLQQWRAHRFIESQRRGHWEFYQLPGKLETWAEEMVRNRKGAVSILQLWYYPGQAAEMPGHTCWETANTVTTTWGSRKSWVLCLLPWLQWQPPQMSTMLSPPYQTTRVWWWWWWFCLRWASYSPPFVADADLELLLSLPSAGITYTAMPSDIWILC